MYRAGRNRRNQETQDGKSAFAITLLRRRFEACARGSSIAERRCSAAAGIVCPRAWRSMSGLRQSELPRVSRSHQARRRCRALAPAWTSAAAQLSARASYKCRGTRKKGEVPVRRSCRAVSLHACKPCTYCAERSEAHAAGSPQASRGPSWIGADALLPWRMTDRRNGAAERRHFARTASS
jgi:hypothetical protein